MGLFLECIEEADDALLGPSSDQYVMMLHHLVLHDVLAIVISKFDSFPYS